jgi:hypothetical protein
MLQRLFASGLWLVLCGALVPSLRIDGDWIGSIQIAKKSVPFNTSFYLENHTIKGKIDIKDTTGIFPKSANGQLVVVKPGVSGHLSFLLETEAGNYEFKGNFSDGKISGDVTHGKDVGTFELVQLTKMDPSIYQQYFGLYRVDSGSCSRNEITNE